MPEAASDDREEAKEYDKCAVGLYKKDILVGHIQIEISSLCFHFINQDPENKIKALTTGKRQREIGLDFPILTLKFKKKAVYRKFPFYLKAHSQV